jgi:hypothetical protein
VISNGTFVPYILGIPSVKAEVMGLVGDNYVLLQEYDKIDEGGEEIHVKKYYYRNQWFIESYWNDTLRYSSSGDGLTGTC